LNLPGIGEVLMGVYLAPFMLPQTQVEDFYNPERFPTWQDQYRVQMQYKGWKRAILSSIRNTVRIEALAEYQAVNRKGLPMLLLWGTQDQTIPAADIELLRSIIPGIEFYAIDSAGHLPHYEQPQTVNPILIDFLSKNRP
jgi:pimeloyl-ACP methyl ester carboxylesterase